MTWSVTLVSEGLVFSFRSQRGISIYFSLFCTIKYVHQRFNQVTRFLLISTSLCVPLPLYAFLSPYACFCIFMPLYVSPPLSTSPCPSMPLYSSLFLSSSPWLSVTPYIPEPFCASICPSTFLRLYMPLYVSLCHLTLYAPLYFSSSLCPLCLFYDPLLLYTFLFPS